MTLQHAHVPVGHQDRVLACSQQRLDEADHHEVVGPDDLPPSRHPLRHTRVLPDVNRHATVPALHEFLTTGKARLSVGVVVSFEDKHSGRAGSKVS